MHLNKRALLAASFLGVILIGWALHMLADRQPGSSGNLSSSDTFEITGPAGAPATPFVTAPRWESIPQPFYVVIDVTGAEEAVVAQPPRSSATSSVGVRRPSATPPTHGGGSSQPKAVGNTTYTTNSTIIATGDNIVIASDGSIVTVGDNPIVRANTGDATASSVIAVDTQDTTMHTGDSAQTVLGTSASSTAPRSSSSTQNAATTTSNVGVATSSNGTGGRAVGIAGYTDRSIGISGSDNVLTYDDSNVFIDRNGTLNGNTGDTDTSGLNVVDSIGSSVRTGNSVGTTRSSNSAPAGNSSVSTTGGTSATVVGPNGTATASGQDTLVIGGDGIQDFGAHIQGNQNVATYDDGNTTIGGTGNVNAQVGDSATSGAVVMGIRDSEVASGNSNYSN